jgi:hypothetical protein
LYSQSKGLSLSVKHQEQAVLTHLLERIQGFLNAGNIDAAAAECDKQKGSVANVIKAGLKKYQRNGK